MSPSRRANSGPAPRRRLRSRPRLPHARDRLRRQGAPCDTACDRRRVLLSTPAVPVPDWVPKDAWEWALIERLEPGEAAPLDRSARVLAGGKPTKSKPWTTILLLGTDKGPGNIGARTDTIIIVAAQHGTGRAAAFGSHAISPKCRWDQTGSRLTTP